MKKIIISILFFAFSISSSFAYTDFELKNEYEKTFERKLSILYPDNKFMVTVTLNPEVKIDSKLFGNIEVQSDQSFSLTRIKKINIATDSDLAADIYSNLLEVPKTVIGIQKSASYQKAAPEVKPKEEKLKEEKPKAEMGKEKIPEKPVITPIEKSLLAVFGLMICGLFYWGVTSLRKLSETIFQASQQKKSEEVSNEPVNKKNNSLNSDSGFANNFSDPSFTPRKDQLKAIFSDLYWSHEDAKASALVMKYQDVATYKELSYGADYLKYLRTVIPQKISFWDDTYFVSPNEALQELSIEDMLVEDFLGCSQFRLQHCPFSSVTLASSTLKQQASREKNPNKSAHRVFSPPVVVSFKTAMDEEEFFNSDLPDNLKSQVSSLSLLSFCDDLAFSSLIDTVNVNQLANIWVGPEKILSSIMERIPERKRNLLKDVLESRNNLNSEQYIIIRSSSAYLGFTNLIKTKIQWKTTEIPVENSIKAVG